MPMTQEEQEADYDAGRLWLELTESTLGLDRCRHPSAEVTSLWLFECVPSNRAKGKPVNVQVGCVSRLGTPFERNGDAYQWEATRMMGGQPMARQCFADLDSALNWIETYEHGRRSAPAFAFNR